MIYTAIAYSVESKAGFPITPEVVAMARAASPQVAMDKLVVAMQEDDPFVTTVSEWVTNNNEALIKWIEGDSSQSYYCGRGRCRYEMQGDN